MAPGFAFGLRRMRRLNGPTDILGQLLSAASVKTSAVLHQRGENLGRSGDTTAHKSLPASPKSTFKHVELYFARYFPKVL